MHLKAHAMLDTLKRLYMLVFEQIKVGDMENYTYLLGDSETKEAAIVDPAWEIDKLIQIIKNHNLQVKYIINTHCHYDHTDGNVQMKKSTGGKIIIHKSEEFYLSNFTEAPADMTIEDGDTVYLGEIEIKFLHTPGHSPGSCCLLVEDNLITGDTLFVGSIGRTDFPGSDPEKMFHSLNDKIKPLSGNIKVYPGHNYGPEKFSTIDNEKRSNEYLKAKDLKSFLNLTTG